ncbi:mechanosensitive ion channel domain-containing protein [Chroococcidiopsis sp. CCMEE 29]|uniref:mechanosensitive ion channel family protein n=1 Tax=Chroococcidiopsis sp. CCMEE 29 TaxID=155894 RepID=UPI0020220C18|nr:mechanosensitive ion channel domain-containing protein [Chroococcidiopsis sp. CCMEE 29]
MSRFRRFGIIYTIPTIVFIVILALMPVQAQPQSTAFITLDGRQLFEVSQSGQFSAENRAADANLILREAVRSTEPATVEVVEINQLPVIRVNGRHLLTVTQQDIPTGRNPEEQAQIWAQRLVEAVEQGQAERRASYFWQALLLTVLAVLGAIALHRTLGWVWRYWLRRQIPKQANDPDTGAQPQGIELFLQLTLAVVRVGLWLVTAIYITDLFPLTREWSRRLANLLLMSLTSPAISLGEASYSVVDLMLLVGLFFGLLAVAGTVTNLLRSRILRITNVNRGVQESIAVIINYSLIFIGTVVLLQIWGLDISSLAILASVLGVGIGIGLQGIAKEFFSGLVITFERPIQIGDFVEVGEFKGTVERLNARSTRIRTLDDISVIVPNSRFLDTEVVNWSHRNSVSRLVLSVPVAYGSTVSTVRSALVEAVKEHPDVLNEPAPKVWFKGFGDNSLDFQLLVWISEPRKQFQIKSDLYFRIEAILRHRDVQIPFPQRSLHLRSGSLPLELSPKLEDSLSQLSEGLGAWLNAQSNGGSFNDPTQPSLEPQDQGKQSGVTGEE